MIRLNGGFIRSAILMTPARRAAWAARTGGVNWVRSVSTSAGMARCSSLAAAMERWIAISRSTGSATSVCSDAVMPDTRLL